MSAPRTLMDAMDGTSAFLLHAHAWATTGGSVHKRPYPGRRRFALSSSLGGSGCHTTPLAVTSEPRDERGDVVFTLRETGLSTRAIAAVTGLGHGTVARAAAGVPNGTPEPTPEPGEPEPVDEPASPLKMGTAGRIGRSHSGPHAGQCMTMRPWGPGTADSATGRGVHDPRAPSDGITAGQSTVAVQIIVVIRNLPHGQPVHRAYPPLDRRGPKP